MALALGFCLGTPTVAGVSIEQRRVITALCPARTLRRQMARLGGRQPQYAIGPGVLVSIVADLDDVDRRDRATTVDR